MSRSTAPGRPYLVRCTSAALATRVKSAIVFSLMVDGSVSRGCRIVPNRKRRCYQRRFGAPTRGTGPLRLALAGATRSGSAGVGSLFRDPLARLRRLQVESIGTKFNFRPAAITSCDIAASAHACVRPRRSGGIPLMPIEATIFLGRPILFVAPRLKIGLGPTGTLATASKSLRAWLKVSAVPSVHSLGWQPG